MATSFDRYDVFTRTWWRKEAGRLVPNAGAKRHYLERNVTLDEARRICREWNATHEPGELSRKAEFQSR